MNKKRFFWPVLSEEEEQQRKEKEARIQVDQAQLATRAVDPEPVTYPFPQSSESSGEGELEMRQADEAMPAAQAAFDPSPMAARADEGYYASETVAASPVMPSTMPPVPAMPSSSAGSAHAAPQDASGQVAEQSSSAYDEGEPQGGAPADEVLLHLENIQRSYTQADSSLVVLDGVNLSVRAGEMVALVAPSGAGKSTLLHMAGLLERPTAGEVYIAGQPQSNAHDRSRTLTRRNEIGFVYQFHHLLAEFSALENVVLPQLIHGEAMAEAQRRAFELLSYMKVDHRAKHRPAELSGGEQQRVAIARAMANAPRVLLADEPTGNLDPNTSEYVFRALNALVKQSGIAALFATHNLFLAERMDRQITLVEGKVVEL